MPDTLLEVRHLRKDYRVSSDKSLRAKTFPAVRDVSFTVRRGETFGLVGESGCGKSTVARLIMCLERPTEGEVWLDGRRVDTLPERERRVLRSRFQMVFQDSGSSLNPRKRVEDILCQPMLAHGLVGRQVAGKRAAELLELVGLSPSVAGRYPHEFSGGQRQRVCIARAIGLNPELLVLDEPVSALDVSVQAQILNLLRDLQERLGLTCVFIGHGLGAVHYISHRVAVMYMGQIVEEGASEALFDLPAHPYTKALLDAAPVADWSLRNRARTSLSGEVGDSIPVGTCDLYHRCPWADARCLRFAGEMLPVRGDAQHCSVCQRALEGPHGEIHP